MANKIFANEVVFLLGAAQKSQFVHNKLPQLVLMGASNVGKSSLINAIFHQKIAISSKTAGRTQQINFFLAKNPKQPFIVVDMPGYGFANVSKQKFIDISQVCLDFLTIDNDQQCLLLLIDPIKELKQSDLDALHFLKQRKFHIVLTKCDKTNSTVRDAVAYNIKQIIPDFNGKIINTSINNSSSIIDLQKIIISSLHLK
jgi:GTP-binding protein